MRTFVVIICLIPFLVDAQSEALKTDFGNSGKMSLNIDDIDHLVGLISDDNNNTYFYGNTAAYQGGAYPFDIFVGKVNEYGQLDQTFGDNGIFRTDFPGFEVSTLNKAVYHPDGIFFLGQGYNHDMTDTFALMLGKINLDGTIDSNFADQGFFTSDFLGTYNTAGSLIIDSNDKIVFCGSTTDDQNYAIEYPLIGRLHLNGLPDSTLGNTGLIVYDYYQDSIIDASQLPNYHFRHGDGAYLTEIVEYNNAYFVTGKFVGTAFSLLHFMSITIDGEMNPNFITSGLYTVQLDPGVNHFVQDIAFDGETFYLGIETQGQLDGMHLIQQVDTSGVLGDLIELDQTDFNMRTKFLSLWNDRLFIGGYQKPMANTTSGFHSDRAAIYCLDDDLLAIPDFQFEEDMNSGEEVGPEALQMHPNFGIVGGDMDNVTGSNFTDLFFMAFQVSDQLERKEYTAELNIFPNPTAEMVYSHSEIGAYTIHDLSGKLVLSGSAKNQINLRGLSPGTYVLSSENFERAIRLVVQ